MIERKKRPVAIRGLLGDQVYMPAPITVKNTVELMKFSEFPTAQEKLLKAELTRMFEIYERHRAWYQPTKMGEKVHWTVMFPVTSKYKCGPTHENAAQAMDRNYKLNKKFSGEQELAEGDGETPLTVDKILDQSLRDEASEIREMNFENHIPPLGE